MRFPDLQQVNDQSALFCALSQDFFTENLSERLGEHRWQLDRETSELTYLNDEGATVTARAEMVASIAPGPRSMLWAWAHPQSNGALTEQVRTYGQTHQIASLTTAELAFPTDATGEDLRPEIIELAHQVAQVTVAITGVSPYHLAPAAGGTIAVFALTNHDFPLMRLDYRVLARLAPYLSDGTIRDQRAAVHGLATLAGWQITWTPDWLSASLHDQISGNSMTTTFNEQAQLVNIQGSIGPTNS